MKDEKVKIIQILFAPLTQVWQQVLLGLGDDGLLYQWGTNALVWNPLTPAISAKVGEGLALPLENEIKA